MEMGGVDRSKNWKMNPYVAGAGIIGLGAGAYSLYKTYKNAQYIDQMKALNAPIQMISL